MKVLHLFSNWKWTGPAEPALHVASSLRKRGHEVTMATGDPTDHEPHFQNQVEARGVTLLRGMTLDKHIGFLRNMRDVRFLTEWLRAHPQDVMHSHMPNDHLIGGRARAKAKLSCPIVRSNYDPEGPAPGIRTRYLLRHHTDFLVLASQGAFDVVRARFDFPQRKMVVIEPGVDTDRFDATRPAPDKRAQYGIAPDEFVIGIVARVQAKRRFDVFLEAIRSLKQQWPKLRVMVVGGGTHIEEVAVKPAKEMGLGETVIFTGIQRADDYLGLLKAFDVKVFLFPGSEGSCRAVREAMSMGLPVLAARRGMLPEIVEDGKTGLVIEDTPGNLAQSLLDLAKNPDKRRRLGREAAETARRRFALPRLAQAYEQVYQQAIAEAGSRK